jgi:hypothetical protein
MTQVKPFPCPAWSITQELRPDGTVLVQLTGELPWGPADTVDRFDVPQRFVLTPRRRAGSGPPGSFATSD